MKVTILGCGASVGVPVIGCCCGVCTSFHPKNSRRRVSVLVQSEHSNVLVDASPDFRAQMLDHPVRHLNGVLFTHDHADHVNGISEFRPINHMMNDVIDIYSDHTTIEVLKTHFPYVFKKPNLAFGWYHPSVSPHVITAGETFSVGDIAVLPFYQGHGKRLSLGYRMGEFAYSTDVNALDDAAFKALQGVRCWVVDCQGYGAQYTHASLSVTLEWIERVKPERAILTHMSHEFEYESLKKELPAGVEPAYDNMVIDNLI